MTSALVIAGQAHLQSYLPTSAATAEVALVSMEGSTVVDGPLPRDPAYWARFVEAGRGQPAVIVWGGDQHDRFLVERTPPLDFVLSTAPDLPLDPRASYVAEAQLRAVFAPSFAGLAELIAELRDAGSPVLVAGTSPPIEDRDAVAARIARDERFAADHEGVEPGTAAASPVPLTSPYTMQKLWSLLQTMTGEVAARAGAPFVAVPDRLRSADGFLLPDYWGEDLRPNAQFGREMVIELGTAAGRTETR